MRIIGFLLTVTIVCLTFRITLTQISSEIRLTYTSLINRNKLINALKTQQFSGIRDKYLNNKNLLNKAVLNGLRDQCLRCAYDNNEVYCNCEQNNFNITEQMSFISEQLVQKNQSKQFEQFSLNGGILTELPNNSFIDLSFKTISIYNPINFRRIHTNAFNSTAHTAQYFGIEGYTNFNLRNDPPNYNLYAALTSLVKVQEIYISLSDSVSHEIPDNAFDTTIGIQTKLNTIVFNTGFNISRIGNNAFSQIPFTFAPPPEIGGQIDLSFVPIGRISSRAFYFDNKTRCGVLINLENCSLTDHSFEGPFNVGNNRPVLVDISFNNVTHIRSEVFQNFLNSGPLYNLMVYSNPLNCDDIQSFEWLLSNRDKYLNRLILPYCANGTSLWDLNIDANSVETHAFIFYYRMIAIIIITISAILLIYSYLLSRLSANCVNSKATNYLKL